MEIYGNCHIWEICKKSSTETNFTIAELSSWPSTRWKWWSKSSPRGSSWTTTPTFETPGTGWILLSYSQACILYNCICSCILFLLRESFMISKKVSPSPSCRLPHFLRWARQPGRTQNLQGSQGPQDGFHNARLNSHPKHLTWKQNLPAQSRPNIFETGVFNPFFIVACYCWLFKGVLKLIFKETVQRRALDKKKLTSHICLFWNFPSLHCEHCGNRLIKVAQLWSRAKQRRLRCRHSQNFQTFFVFLPEVSKQFWKNAFFITFNLIG